MKSSDPVAVASAKLAETARRVSWLPMVKVVVALPPTSVIALVVEMVPSAVSMEKVRTAPAATPLVGFCVLVFPKVLTQTSNEESCTFAVIVRCAPDGTPVTGPSAPIETVMVLT